MNTLNVVSHSRVREVKSLPARNNLHRLAVVNKSAFNKVKKRSGSFLYTIEMAKQAFLRGRIVTWQGLLRRIRFLRERFARDLSAILKRYRDFAKRLEEIFGNRGIGSPYFATQFAF